MAILILNVFKIFPYSHFSESTAQSPIFRNQLPVAECRKRDQNNAARIVENNNGIVDWCDHGVVGQHFAQVHLIIQQKHINQDSDVNKAEQVLKSWSSEIGTYKRLIFLFSFFLIS